MANKSNAYAKLVSQKQGAFMRRTGNSPRTQSVLQALYADRLHDVLWAAAEHEAGSINPQVVANTVWALATLDMPPQEAWGKRSGQPLSVWHLA
jgi:hypothetical protein